MGRRIEEKKREKREVVTTQLAKAPLFPKYTPSALFCWFFFHNVTELYELRNDTCFLSVMSRNLTDYTIVPSLASGMLRKFTDCALMLPFDSRHVAELHGLPNDGCQVPRSGQAKVASHLTYGPRTKFGYDSRRRRNPHQIASLLLL